MSTARRSRKTLWCRNWPSPVTWKGLPSGLPRAEEDHGDAERDDRGTQPVETVRPAAVDAPAPQQAHDHEDAAVGGVHPAEVGGALERRDDPVPDQDDRARQADRPGRALAQPAPDQVAAADLSEAGGGEQPDTAYDVHGPTLAPGPARRADQTARPGTAMRGDYPVRPSCAAARRSPIRRSR